LAWNVDRLGRSLKDLVAFLSELHALGGRPPKLAERIRAALAGGMSVRKTAAPAQRNTCAS
jgi:DNA invertase Pin-like site-specific DNA recombinase